MGIRFVGLISLAGWLAGCSTDSPIAPVSALPAPALLSVALRVTGDPSTLDRQNIVGYRERFGDTLPVFNIALEPNDSTRIPLLSPFSYLVERYKKTTIGTAFGTIWIGLAHTWCTRTTPASQSVIALPAANLAISFSYDCPPAVGTGKLRVSVTTTGTGVRDSVFDLVVTRTGPGPTAGFYRESRIVPANGTVDLELPLGVYAVQLIETAGCRVRQPVLSYFTNLGINPATVMLHPDGGTYVFQGTQASFVAFPVTCQ